MKHILPFILLNSIGCSGQSSTDQLSVKDFQEKLKQTSSPAIIDVRSSEEFKQGHLKGALNMNWNDKEFYTRLESVKKNDTCFVYCLSGGRSSSAAQKMREMGYKQVYEMKGGLLTWRSASLPEEGTGREKGISKAQFNELISSAPLVLVDVYADWCAPCKRMAPELETIKKEYGDKLKLVKINADKNQDLIEFMDIGSLPTIIIFKNGTMSWGKAGYIEPDIIRKKLSN